MRRIDNILVAIDDIADVPFVMEKAAALAKAASAKTHVVRVAFEELAEFGRTSADDRQMLKTYVLQADEQELEDALEDARPQFRDLETTTIWHKRVSQGVLDVADLVKPDLIVKATHAPEQGRGRVLDDWHLLRNESCPVLLVKPSAWVKNPVVLAAINGLDDDHEPLNLAVLERAGDLARALTGRLHVVNAYPAFERWVGQLGDGVDYEALVGEVETEIRDRVHALADRAGASIEQLHVREGKASFVIGQLAEETSAEALVIGTAARGGVKGVVFGNTAEAVLHHVDADVLTVRV